MPDPIGIDFEWSSLPIGKIYAAVGRRSASSRTDILWWVGPLLIAIFGPTLLYFLGAPDDIVRAFPSVFFVAILLSIALVLPKLWRANSGLIAATQSPSRRGNTHLHLSEKGIETTHPLYTSCIKWPSVVEIIMLDSATILMLGPHQFLPLDHASLKGVTIEELHGAIAQWRREAEQEIPKQKDAQ